MLEQKFIVLLGQLIHNLISNFYLKILNGSGILMATVAKRCLDQLFTQQMLAHTFSSKSILQLPTNLSIQLLTWTTLTKETTLSG